MNDIEIAFNLQKKQIKADAVIAMTGYSKTRVALMRLAVEVFPLVEIQKLQRKHPHHSIIPPPQENDRVDNIPGGDILDDKRTETIEKYKWVCFDYCIEILGCGITERNEAIVWLQKAEEHRLSLSKLRKLIRKDCANQVSHKWIGENAGYIFWNHLASAERMLRLGYKPFTSDIMPDATMPELKKWLKRACLPDD